MNVFGLLLTELSVCGGLEAGSMKLELSEQTLGDIWRVSGVKQRLYQLGQLGNSGEILQD